MADRTKVGWQRHTRTRVWHYYPGAVWYSFSICQRFTRGPWPMSEEPSSINICDRCVAEMRRVVERLERHPDLLERLGHR